MPFLNITFKIEKDFDRIDQKTKDGHDWTARIMVGHGKKIGSKLVSLAHSSFLEEGYLQTSPWTKRSKSGNHGKRRRSKMIGVNGCLTCTDKR